MRVCYFRNWNVRFFLLFELNLNPLAVEREREGEVSNGETLGLEKFESFSPFPLSSH